MTWRCHLVNADMFTAVTDHNPLTLLHTQKVLSMRQTRRSECLQVFTCKWLYRPGKNNAAEPFSRTPAIVSPILPAAGSASWGSCAALRCQGNRQKLTFKWARSEARPKVSEPLSAELMASCAALTPSQVSTPSPVPLLPTHCLHLSQRVLPNPRNLQGIKSAIGVRQVPHTRACKCDGSSCSHDSYQLVTCRQCHLSQSMSLM